MFPSWCPQATGQKGWQGEMGAVVAVVAGGSSAGFKCCVLADLVTVAGGAGAAGASPAQCSGSSKSTLVESGMDPSSAMIVL